MDFSHDLVSKEKGKTTSLVVVIISTVLTIAFAAKLFGAF
jgi:succinate dehydrogenase / fumarate reductase cytochrome b subunit